MGKLYTKNPADSEDFEADLSRPERNDQVGSLFGGLTLKSEYGKRKIMGLAKPQTGW